MPTRRKAALLRAWQLYHRTGWCSRYRKFRSFIKRELLPGFDKEEGFLVRLENMVDRLINGPHDVTHCIAGPWLKPLILSLKRLWAWDAPIFYGSCGPEFLHRFLVERLIPGGGTYFWSDFTMFDATHSEDSWAFMESLYREAGVDEPDFWKVMDAWRQPEGYIKSFKYKGPVMNASGRDDTSLANGVLNGFAMYLSVTAAWFDVDLMDLTVEQVEQMKGLLVLSVTGDDSIGRLPTVSAERAKQLANRVRENVAMFGFVTKFAYSDRLCDAVYLGMRPYPTEKGWFWGKTIGRASYKMGWMLDTGNRDPMAHITGIADMHVLCSSHVPVLSDLAAKIVELRTGAKRTPVAMDPAKPWEWTYKSGVKYDRLTLQAVAEAYTTKKTDGVAALADRSVSVEDVESLIAAIRGVKQLPCVLDHWLWKHMVVVDEL